MIARLMGFHLAGLGVLIFLLTAAVGILTLPPAVLTVGVALVVGAVLVAGFPVHPRARGGAP